MQRALSEHEGSAMVSCDLQPVDSKWKHNHPWESRHQAGGHSDAVSKHSEKSITWETWLSFFVILNNHMLREQSLVLGNLLYLGMNGKPGKTFYKTFYYVDQL